ncbi:MAG: FtsX-like permease family protein, partial [Acidobacteria bacterium]
PEMALRAALGASRSRLVRQLVIEALVLGGIAALAGVLIARAGLAALAANAPVRIPRLDGAAADPWLFALAGAIALVAVLIAAVVPAFISTGASLESTLRESKQTSSRGALRARRWMMAAEIAAALLVTAGAGLMYRTVDRLLAVDPGFRSHGVMTAGLSLIGQRWAEDDPVRAFQRDLVARMRAVPGVEIAALAGQVPLGGNYDRWTAHLTDRPSSSEAEEPSAERYSVTPDYFRLMGIPLKAGRLLNDDDRFGAEMVIVINETFARQVWPGESPIGKRVRFGSAARPRPALIVGVVGDVRHYALAQPPNPQFYTTQEQFTDSFLILLIRASQPGTIGPAIRQEVAALATDVAVYDVQPFDALVSTSIATRSFLMLLLAGLGGVTLVLAGVGLYGVVSQSVGARRRELGIRVALGADRASVTALVAREGFRVFAAGAVLGVTGAAFAGQLIKSQLFEVRPFDPLTLLGALCALSAVAVIAHVGPIRRALRADPRETLKSD